MNNADPHLGKPPSNGSPDPYGSSDSPSFGSANPTESSGPGPSSIRRRRNGRKSRRTADDGPTLAETAVSGWRHALEFGDYVRTLITTRADRAAAAARKKFTKIGVVAIAAIGAIVIVISASLRFVSGVANGLAVLFEGRAWLGDLAAGLLILGGLAAATAIYLSTREKKELEEHLEKYERHHREHRARHGHFVGDPSPEDTRRAPRS
jgi:hypothetical protein